MNKIAFTNPIKALQCICFWKHFLLVDICLWKLTVCAVNRSLHKQRNKTAIFFSSLDLFKLLKLTIPQKFKSQACHLGFDLHARTGFEFDIVHFSLCKGQDPWHTQYLLKK
jgi:hypothetical protein